jgi:hypothetical protein
MPNWKKVVTSGSAAELSTLSLTGLSAQNSETDVLTINTSNVIGSRQLGSNAFNSTTFNTVIGTDSDITTSGATVIDDIYMTDGVISSHTTRTLTLANLGYTGATDANNYVLPTNLAGDDINIDTGALTGATVISDLDFNITTNTSGLVTDANGTVSTRTLTAANLGVGSSDDVTFGSITISTGKIDYGTNTDVDTGTENVATATSAEAAFFDYVVKNGTNIRAGTITAATDGTNVEYNEVSTVDLGSTSDVKLKVVLSSSDLILQATAASDNWNVSSFVRYMAL